MAAGLENVFENETIRAIRPSGGHASIEINAHCPFSSDRGCGDRCILQARRAPQDHLLTEEQIHQIFDEILDCGPLLRHFGIPGMEPLASPDLLFSLLEKYHSRPPSDRPLTFNIITSGVNLERHRGRFGESPLDALIISVDDARSTGLRIAGAGEAALRTALRLREAGGCRFLCINSVLTATNSDSVLATAELLRAANVDQMLVSPLRRAKGGELEPVVTQADLLSFARRAARMKTLAGLPLLVEVDLETLRGLAEREGGSSGLSEEWAHRHPLVDSSVALLSVNPDSRFLRVRWDGQLMLRRELFGVGLDRTTLGSYRRGRIQEIMTAKTRLAAVGAQVA